ncbi:MAG: DNA polymerase III subunit alpha [Bacteroidales bacterium]|nr:DNA polymerase III subunit alpha [Bacteroidales bacterium]
MYLNCHSYYSLRYGTISVESLVDDAVRTTRRVAPTDIAPSHVALTDINNTTGIMEFVAVCKEKGIKPIAGIEFRREDKLLYIGLAKNNKGFRELNEFLSYHNLNNQPLPDHPPEFQEVVVIYPFRNSEMVKWRNGENRHASRVMRHDFIGIRPSELNPLILSRHRDLIPRMVLMAPVTFRNEKEYELHRNFRAVDHNVLLSRLEPHQVAAPDEVMLPVDELLDICSDFPEIIRNTQQLMEACSIDFDFKACKNKKTFTGNRYDDLILLDKLAMDGLQYRYGKGHGEARRRIRHELDIIDKMGFAAYFLITWDIIRYSMSRGFYHVGRGSGANSIVAYCLRITDVDPIELDLYFERFINPKRTSPPDFDIDYSWKERDEVLDYIFKRYGHEHTALLGAMSTFKDKSIYRELGKVHGLPKGEIDAFLKHPEEAIHKNHIIRKINELGVMMADFPNIRSIHAGGVLISEEPITCYTALDLPPKGFPTTQFDMYIAEDISFEKLDILSQRGIGHIYEAAELVKKNRGISVDVHMVHAFKEDEKVKEQLRNARTIGCFYVESPAMRGLLKKLHCDNYRTLVAASSIIRPGVARSGMMKEYIFRFHHPGKFKYLHPVMEEQLKETFGVMVYQEDVLKICHHFAGLDLADADVIRRAMSGKYRSKKELERIIEKFFENCRKSGYPEEVTKEVWRQIESFAGYSFSKAHSASYAVESYQSLYLKAHYPLEFITGVINNFGGFYSSWVYFNEARISGANLHVPCVNRSEYKTCIRGKDIFLGFIHVANLETGVAKAIYDLRMTIDDFRKTSPDCQPETADWQLQTANCGLPTANSKLIEKPYTSLENFIQRVPVTLDQLIILIRVGAFRFTGKPKASLLWEAHMLMGKNQTPAKNREIDQSSIQSSIVNRPIVNPVLFQTAVKKFELPALEQNTIANVYDEIELLGFPVTSTYFDLLHTKFRGDILAHEMSLNAGRTIRMLGLLVTIKYVRTVKREWMHFGTFIDVNGHFFDTVHFPKAVTEYPFRGDGVYLVKGKIVEEFGFPSMNVEKMAKMPLQGDPRG